MVRLLPLQSISLLQVHSWSEKAVLRNDWSDVLYNVVSKNPNYLLLNIVGPMAELAEQEVKEIGLCGNNSTENHFWVVNRVIEDQFVLVYSQCGLGTFCNDSSFQSQSKCSWYISQFGYLP